MKTSRSASNRKNASGRNSEALSRAGRKGGKQSAGSKKSRKSR